MNYQILKNIIENLISNFNCPSCTSQVDEDSLEIIGAAGNSINVSITCPSCSKNAMIRTEVAHVNLGSMDPSTISEQIQSKIRSLKGDIKKIDKTTIKDEQIIDLNKRLKTISGVTDLFNEN